MAIADRPIKVEVVYALPDAQTLIEVEIAPGTTAWQAVMQSGILQRFPQIDPAGRKMGIFGRPVSPDAVLKDGDRVEIYWPLVADPKEVRRKRAKRKR